MDEKFTALLGRLETVTARLESVDMRGAAAPGPGAGTSASAVGGVPSAGSSTSVLAFNALIEKRLEAWATIAEKVAPETAKQATHVRAAFQAQARFLALAAQCSKPAAEELPMLLSDTSKAIGQVQAAADKRSKDFNCLNAVSEGIAALGWIGMEPTPVPYVEEMRNASDFYGNKVLMQFRNEPGDDAKARTNFVNEWREVLTALAAYVKEYHRTGVSWNPKGAPVAQTSQMAAAPTERPPPGGPSVPPPPPPPPPAGGPPPPTAPAGGMAAVFAQINKGEGEVTAGLRHVLKGDKSTPPASVASVQGSRSSGSGGESATTAAGISAQTKPPRKALEGKKWMVEFFKNDTAIVIDRASLKETVYVYKCDGCTVQIKGKVNQITLDSCKRTQVLFDSVMAGFDVVNCTGCKAQVTGTVSTISVDKCEGTQLILSQASLTADIISAKSSELNIIVPGATENDEYKEHAIPEQFISKYDKGKFVTTTLEHTA